MTLAATTVAIVWKNRLSHSHLNLHSNIKLQFFVSSAFGKPHYRCLSRYRKSLRSNPERPTLTTQPRWRTNTVSEERYQKLISKLFCLPCFRRAQYCSYRSPVGARSSRSCARYISQYNCRRLWVNGDLETSSSIINDTVSNTCRYLHAALVVNLDHSYRIVEAGARAEFNNSLLYDNALPTMAIICAVRCPYISNVDRG